MVSFVSDFRTSLAFCIQNSVLVKEAPEFIQGEEVTVQKETWDKQGVKIK